MKAIVFTLDALFALIIASASISILLYFNFSAQTPYSITYADAQGILTNLLSTPVDVMQNSSVLARTMVNQFAGANETWPQLMGNAQMNGSTAVGPIKPIISSIYVATNTVTTSVIADYGNIYFAANNVVYAVNATTNRVLWSRYVVTNVIYTPALYSGMLIFANSSYVVALNALTGTQVWRTSLASQASSPITVYSGMVMFGSANSKISALNANNGTAAWSNTVESVPLGVLVVGGSPASKTSANTIFTEVSTQTVAGELVSKSFSLNSITNVAAQGATMYFGFGSSLDMMVLNGIAPSSLPVSFAKPASGVALQGNRVIFQTSTNVIAAAPLNVSDLIWNGTVYWNIAVPPYFGNAIANAVPVIARNNVYTLWKNGIAAQNITNGAVLWFALMPNANTMPYMSLAYGKLYVVSGNKIFAFGSCQSPLHASAFVAVAGMSVNGAPGCAEALSNAVYPAANYTIFTGNAINSYIRAASFDGNSHYLAAGNTGPLNSSYVTASFWVNISSYPASGARIVNYGDTGTCYFVNDCGWFFYMLSNGLIQFNVMNINQTTVNGIVLSKNKWYQITGTYDGSNVKLYVNAGLPFKVPRVGVMADTTPNINLTIGTGLDGKYFTGNIANLQVYNKSLTNSQVQQLYLRGIPGAPMQSSGLVAWYPLSGDTNDYALFNPAYSAGVGFVTQNYIIPSLANTYGISRSGIVVPLLNYSTGSYKLYQAGIYSWR